MRFHRTSLIVPTCLCALASAGNLNPPAGPVAPTMLPLDKIETRQCINDLPGAPDAVHAITQPGVYFISADIVAPPGMSAVLINLPPGTTEQVVIDQGDYSLIGNGGGSGSGYRWTQTQGPFHFSSSTGGRISGFGSHGIEVLGASDVTIDGATIDSCGGDGIHVVNSVDVTISAFNVSDCPGSGITVNGADFVAINEKGLPGEKRIKKRTHSRVADVGGHGIHLSDCDDGNIQDFDLRLIGGDGIRVEHSVPGAQMRLGVSNGGIEHAGGNGITVLAGQSIASAFIRRMHVKEAIDGFYAEDLQSVEISDWSDEDCNDDGIESLTALGQSLNTKFHTIATTVSKRAGGSGIEIVDNSGGASSGSFSDCTVVDSGSETITCKMGRVELARVTSSGGGGVLIDATDVTLQDVRMSKSVGPGAHINVSGSLVVSDMVATGNSGEGIIVFGAGLAKTDITNLRVMSNGFGVGGVSLDGALLSAMDTVTVRDSTFSGNAGSGLRVADLNRDGMLDVVVCSANGSNGFTADSPSGVGSGRLVLISGSFGSNSGDGIFLEATTGGQIVDCTATNNAGAGIHVIGTGHIVQRNALLSNGGGPMLVPPGNVVGPLVDELTIPANSNPAANYVH